MNLLREKWHGVRGMLLSSPMTNRFLFNVLTSPAQLRARWLAWQGHWDGIDLISPNDLRSRIRPDAEVCHIIGAGWSVNSSKSLIREGDFVIGFNFAALIKELTFDLYLCELHTHKDPRRRVVSDLLANLVKENLGSRIRTFFFHSAWLGYLDADLIRSSFGSKVSCLSDYMLSSRYLDVSGHMRKVVVDRLLKSSSSSTAVVATTAITSIGLAYRLGFRRIVIHGLDGGGPHFFATPDFAMPEGYEAILDFYPRATQQSAYYPGTLGLQLLPELLSGLSKRGVALYAGSKHSPASEILPVFSRQDFSSEIT